MVALLSVEPRLVVCVCLKDTVILAVLAVAEHHFWRIRLKLERGLLPAVLM